MYIVIPLVSMLAMLLAAAHFWRSGAWRLGLACLVLGGLLWLRKAWIRLALIPILLGLAGRWVWTTGMYAQLRIMLGEPWQRLVIILLGVAAFTALAAGLLLTASARKRYAGQAESAAVQAVSFLLVTALLGLTTVQAPQLLLADRLLPGSGMLQALGLGFWAVLVAGSLSDRRGAPAARLRIWRVFSIVFFAQLVLGLTVSGLFLMTGKLHIPVPGLILLAPLYRGDGFFMLLLFGLSFLLVGPAWCSQLCYFGVWDADAARRQRPVAPPAWLKRLPFVVLGLAVAVVSGLKAAQAPDWIAGGAGLALGLSLIPMAWFFSRKWGVAAYCLGCCPLGLVVRLASRLSLWRIRRTPACTDCGACSRSCRQGALSPGSLRNGEAGPSCNLCRDCLAVCPRRGLGLRVPGLSGDPGLPEKIFLVLITVLHSLFLGMARV